MQTIGFIIDRRTNEKIKLLVRKGRMLDTTYHIIKLKMRKSGRDGSHFTDEENHLNDDYELMDKLKIRESVDC